ncbi:hypothetical protein [Streptococcus dentiloxodontae]
MKNMNPKTLHLLSGILSFLAGLIFLFQNSSRILGILFICLGAGQTALAVGKSNDDSGEN